MKPWAAKYYKGHAGRHRYVAVVKNCILPGLTTNQKQAAKFATKAECEKFIATLPALLSVACESVRLK